MPFHSLLFLVSFLFICIIYYLIPSKVQWYYLLIVSFVYYVYWDIKSTAFLVISICITYGTGLLIEKEQVKNRTGKKWLIVSLAINFALLIFFKYIQNAFSLNLLVPVGISFYTFRAAAYIIDIYRGKITAERNWSKYALYVSFFPQIVSGPIERSYNFIPQLKDKISFSYDTVKEGFLLFLLGLFQKIVFADRFTLLVDQVFNHVKLYDAPAYVVAIFFFTMQIYFDFAGYSNMAIGCSKMLGIKSIQNFNRPYFSSSIADFWRKWHISLSTWFRDYLYIPLGGNRVSPLRWTCNIMIVFLISGLWHGANWTFLVWGAIHGIYQIIGKFSSTCRQFVFCKLHLLKIHTFCSYITTFILVSYAWLFFRANSIADAVYITKRLVTGRWTNITFENLGLGKQDILLSCILLIIWFLLEFVQAKVNLYQQLRRQCLLVRWTIYLVFIFMCILFGMYGDLTSASFIYFQF